MLPTHNKWRSLSFGHIFRSNCLFNGTEREYHYFVSLTLTQEVSSWLMICGESKLFRSWIKIQHLAEGCLWLRSILGTLSSRLFVYSELWRICIILYFCLLACMHWSRSLTWFALNSPAYKYTGDNEHNLEHIVLSKLVLDLEQFLLSPTGLSPTLCYEISFSSLQEVLAGGWPCSTLNSNWVLCLQNKLDGYLGCFIGVILDKARVVAMEAVRVTIWATLDECRLYFKRYKTQLEM